MSARDDLIEKLREIFELDKADLDFGLYRILRVRRDRVEEYLTKSLPAKVSETLVTATYDDSAERLKKAKDKLMDALGADAVGEDGAVADKYAEMKVAREYTEALAATRAGGDTAKLEAEVYRHLQNFFSRYYEGGDFISQRRYTSKETGPTYAVPYAGEEVMLHWANKDQYYIKSSEDLKDFRTKLPDPAKPGEFLTLSFRLIAADPVDNNNKAKRVLELARPDTDGPDAAPHLTGDNRTLIVAFRFSRVEKTVKGADETEEDSGEKAKKATKPAEALATALLNHDGIPKNFKAAFELDDEDYAKTNTKKGLTRTKLERALANFTGLGSRDFFIHKNLAAFLRRELDHYIKGEVMQLDSVDEKAADYLAGEIRKIKAIRTVAHDLIRFLAQFEDFQKRLWLKKKFVTGTRYLVTVDRISAKLRDTVAASTAQWADWETLGLKPAESEAGAKATKGKKAKDDEPMLTGMTSEDAGPKPVEWGTRAYLDAHDKLPVNTRHFDAAFVDALLASKEVLAGESSIDAAQTGLLVHSENFQALNFLKERHKTQVKCIYIDPPYNTGNDGFMYKDEYQHSSWLSMMESRILKSADFLHNNGSFFASIDEMESHRLKFKLSECFGDNGCVADIVWQKRYAPDVRTAISDAHEYIFAYAKDRELFKTARNKLPLTDAQTSQFKNTDNDPNGPWKAADFTAQGFRPNQMYKITGPTGKVFTPPAGRCWGVVESVFKDLTKNGLMYFGSDGTGVPSVKRYLKEMDGMVSWTWWSHQDVGHSQDGLKAVMQLFGREEAFMTAKPPALIERILRIATNGGDLVLDYFAGSGTTGHAVINLNREDGGTRKFILVEMGEYFDTVLTPRITKALYSPDWKDGHAQSHDKGVSALVKILKLESYEDTLNNLAITTGEGAAKQTDLFAELNAAGQSRVAEEYLLGYSLDMETKDGLLRTKDFAKPFGYALRTYDRTTGDRDAVMYADLPETFNALLGLRVILRRLDRDILRIEGTNRQGERILILWRDCTVADCAKLAAYAEKLDLNPADTEFTAIYVNGDHTLHDPHKKIHRIEKTFAELMFEGCDE